MSTIVFFHAHPDDECIGTGGSIALAGRAGHRVVLVVATRGEHGSVVPGMLPEGNQLGILRIGEAMQAAEVLGIDRVEFLGYVDSGMMGDATNDDPYAFWRADVDSAARRLAAILDEEQADVLVTYDPDGNYGHPDHIQVHRVGYRAAEFARTPRVYEMTMNRDAIIESMTARRATASPEELAAFPEIDPESFTMGTPEAELTHCIDVASVVELKRAAMRCHRSQIADDDFFLALSDEDFATAFGREWYIDRSRPRAEGGEFLTTLFD